jgi:hypothetical protein
MRSVSICGVGGALFSMTYAGFYSFGVSICRSQQRGDGRGVTEAWGNSRLACEIPSTFASHAPFLHQLQKGTD